MKDKSGPGLGIALSILSFIIGLAGIVLLFFIGQSNDLVLAIVAVLLPFMLFAGFFSWLAPNVRWRIAISMLVPIIIFSILAELSGSTFMFFTLLVILMTVFGANLGAWLRTGRI